VITGRSIGLAFAVLALSSGSVAHAASFNIVFNPNQAGVGESLGSFDAPSGGG